MWPDIRCKLPNTTVFSASAHFDLLEFDSNNHQIIVLWLITFKINKMCIQRMQTHQTAYYLFFFQIWMRNNQIIACVLCQISTQYSTKCFRCCLWIKFIVVVFISACLLSIWFKIWKFHAQSILSCLFVCFVHPETSSFSKFVFVAASQIEENWDEKGLMNQMETYAIYIFTCLCDFS